jgi:cytoskeleton protein RodZ
MVVPKDNFGERLRAARESKEITLEEISSHTRVSVRLLSAIEEEEFSKLPGGLFNVAFVRQYAKQVGLDEDSVVEEFKAMTQPTELVVLTPERNEEDRGATFVEGVVERAREYQLTAPIVMTVLLAVITGAVMLVQWDWDAGFATISESFLWEQAGAQKSSPTPAGTASPTTASVRPYVEPKPVSVQLSISATVWIEAIADGERVFRRNFRSGESRQVEADKQIRLLVGNAGGVTVSLNGEPMPSVGSSGQVRRVLLTVRGMEIVQPQAKNNEDGESPRSPQVQASASLSDGEPTLASIAPSN